jgi:hypothetical protein
MNAVEKLFNNLVLAMEIQESPNGLTYRLNFENKPKKLAGEVYKGMLETDLDKKSLGALMEQAALKSAAQYYSQKYRS